MTIPNQRDFSTTYLGRLTNHSLSCQIDRPSCNPLPLSIIRSTLSQIASHSPMFVGVPNLTRLSDSRMLDGSCYPKPDSDTKSLAIVPQRTHNPLDFLCQYKASNHSQLDNEPPKPAMDLTSFSSKLDRITDRLARKLAFAEPKIDTHVFLTFQDKFCGLVFSENPSQPKSFSQENIRLIQQDITTKGLDYTLSKLTLGDQIADCMMPLKTTHHLSLTSSQIQEKKESLPADKFDPMVQTRSRLGASQPAQLFPPLAIDHLRHVEDTNDIFLKNVLKPKEKLIDTPPTISSMKQVAEKRLGHLEAPHETPTQMPQAPSHVQEIGIFPWIAAQIAHGLNDDPEFTYVPKVSRRLDDHGSDLTGPCILHIAGVDYTKQEHESNVLIIEDIVPKGTKILHIYNQTNGVVIDFLEAIFFNTFGFSPITSGEIQKTVADFHKSNLDKPDLKLMLPCHSAGAIHTNNALSSLPKHLKDRVIVVAVAPGGPVDAANCHKVLPLVSEGDIVPKLHFIPESIIAKFAEMMPPDLLNSSDDPDLKPSLYPKKEAYDRIEKLGANPEPSDRFTHSFKNKTYRDELTKHLTNYIKNPEGVDETP